LVSIFFVAVGGTERFYGPLLGAILLTILPEMLRFLGDFRMVAYGILVLAITVLFPRGLESALHGRFATRPSKPALAAKPGT
jgi:branched-chain amino acid transport system permease protein